MTYFVDTKKCNNNKRRIISDAKDNTKIDESFFKKLSKPQLPPSSRPKVTLNDVEELLNQVFIALLI